MIAVDCYLMYNMVLLHMVVADEIDDAAVVGAQAVVGRKAPQYASYEFEQCCVILKLLKASPRSGDDSSVNQKYQREYH